MRRHLGANRRSEVTFTRRLGRYGAQLVEEIAQQKPENSKPLQKSEL